MTSITWISTATTAVIAALLAEPAAVDPSPRPGAIAPTHAAVARLTDAGRTLSGGRPLDEMSTLEVEFTGVYSHWLQGTSPEVPLSIQSRIRKLVDWRTNELILARHQTSTHFDYRTSVGSSLDRDDARSLAGIILDPLTVVRQLLSRRSELRLLDDAESSVTLIGIVEGRMASLTLDERGLPRSLKYFYSNAYSGDSERTVEYLEYFEEGAWLMPRIVRGTVAGRVDFELTVESFQVNPERPAWASGVASVRSPEGERAPMESMEVSPGIHVVNIPGQAEYRAMLVELEEGVLLLEAPEALGDGEELSRLVRDIAGKPITLVIPSHHHIDHSAGALAFASTATILTTPGNVAWFTSLVQSPREFQTAFTVSDHRIHVLDGDETIGPVRVLDVGPTGHADEHLIFHFQDTGILFQSDMFFGAGESVRPAWLAACVLAAAIETHGLAVDMIVNSHGPIGTIDDLHRAIALREEPCPGNAMTE